MGNLALNKIASASSFVAPYLPGRAVDGNSTVPTSRWLCDKLPGFMTVDLGATYWSNRWVVRHMENAGWTADYNMTDFKLQGSNDNSTWMDIDTVTGNTSKVTDRTFTPVGYRFMRLYVTKGLKINPQVASCMELEIYEAQVGLVSLTLSQGTLTPNFSPSVTNYSAAVENDVTNITVTPTAQNANSTIKVNGTVVASGTASQPIALNEGTNAIVVEVTVPNTGVKTTYNVNVTRKANLYLTKVDLTYSGKGFSGSSTVNMDHMNLKYSDMTSTKAAQVIVTPFAEDTAVTINVNGQSLSSGTASSAISIPNTSNQLNIIVSKNGSSDSRNYALNINKV